MRTGTWIALTLGVVITGLGVGLAQDKKPPVHPLVKKTAQDGAVWTDQKSTTTPRRGGLTIQGDAKPRQASANRTPQRYSRTGTQTSVRVVPSQRQTQPPTMPATRLPAAARSSSLQPIPKQSTDKSRPVIHAEYRADPKTNQKRIQQIDGSAEEATPF
ncbi:MAG: hypothetical protein ABGZ17_30780, partial [Planctomycetaceae bacterium]